MHWTYGSFHVQGEAMPPKQTGKTLCVIGPARNVWEDWQRVPVSHGDICTINDILGYVPEDVTWGCSLHWDRLLAWYGVRQQLYHKSPPVRLVSAHRRDGIDVVIRFVDEDLTVFQKGSSIENSGVYALCVGVVMDYARIILVGCPGDGSGHLFHPPYRAFPGYADAGARQAWEQALMRHPEIPERVRSMSGMTKDLLGAPTFDGSPNGAHNRYVTH